jgi:hypothetical protein
VIFDLQVVCECLDGVSTVCWPPVRVSGDLCMKLMNVHLALHLHNISGSMSPRHAVNTVMGKDLAR